MHTLEHVKTHSYAYTRDACMYACMYVSMYACKCMKLLNKIKTVLFDMTKAVTLVIFGIW